MEVNTIHTGDAKKILETFPDNSVHCIVTSPPYYGLRDYGCEGQMGLEETPKDFIINMVGVFNECKRVLRNDGTLWLNIGDSYASGGRSRTEEQCVRNANITGKKSQLASKNQINKISQGLKPKDLIGIPWMLAFALRADGWYLRQDIIWHKPNPMPESVTDRCTKSHEYLFLLSKSAKYYYDAEAIKTPVTDSTVQRLLQDIENQNGSDRVPGKTNGNMKAVKPAGWSNSGYYKDQHPKYKKRDPKLYIHRGDGDKNLTRHSGSFNANGELITNGKANKRSVWSVTTMPYSEAHFATFPEALIVDCIKAGSSEHGCCRKCLSPYERIFTKELIPGPKASFNSKADSRDFNADKQDQGSNKMKDGHKPGWVNDTNTTGWKASCKCNSEITQCIILDPFMGAGTTALVARKLLRNFVGIELNPACVKLAEKRLKKELGLFI